MEAHRVQAFFLSFFFGDSWWCLLSLTLCCAWHHHNTKSLIRGHGIQLSPVKDDGHVASTVDTRGVPSLFSIVGPKGRAIVCTTVCRSIQISCRFHSEWFHCCAGPIPRVFFCFFWIEIEIDQSGRHSFARRECAQWRSHERNSVESYGRTCHREQHWTSKGIICHSWLNIICTGWTRGIFS